VRGRLAYPERLIERVVSLTGLSGEDAVLDLGCGPGFLAVAFARYAGRVFGMDPEPEMLEAAAEYVGEEKVEFRLGSSYDLEKLTGTFRVVTMGRSFHWMDRAATLEALDRIVMPGGAVALFRDSHLEVPQNRWREEFRAILEPFLSKDPGHSVHGRRGPGWIPHEAVLLESAFNQLERHSVIQRLETPVERLIDRALSMSSTSPERLGAEMEAVTARLREVLNGYAVDGVIVEVVESEALVAFRISI
jgi:ubiquinone/menaquinone biosynthesis C-methylase UbiE